MIFISSTSGQYNLQLLSEIDLYGHFTMLTGSIQSICTVFMTLLCVFDVEQASQLKNKMHFTFIFPLSGNLYDQFYVP